MKRFIPAPVYQNTLGKEGFSLFLQSALVELLTQLRKELYETGNTMDSFVL
jgi:hypothetical protein